MEDYAKRMIDEHKKLNKKIRKLKKVIEDESFLEKIGNEKACLLVAQYHAMETYDFILSQRLCIELNEGNCTLEDLS